MSERMSCGHAEWRDGHCAQMHCHNYINKCRCFVNHSGMQASVAQSPRQP